MSDPTNPYTPPDANLAHPPEPIAELASYGQRLGGAILDNLMVGLVALAGGMILFAVGGEAGIQSESFAYVVLGLALLAWFGLNLYPLATRGQTVGKMAVGSQIVGIDDGLVPSLWKTAGLRYFVVSLIASIPVLGGLFSLVNALFVFREDRRCIHDLMAGTQVIVYRPERS